MKKEEINNMLRQFNKLFTKKTENRDTLKSLMAKKLLMKDKYKKQISKKAYLDLANVIAIIPKITLIPDLIESEFESNSKLNSEELIKNIKNVIFESKLRNFKDRNFSSDFSGKYLSIIFNLVKYSDYVNISVGKNSPILIEDNNFIIILAPKVK